MSRQLKHRISNRLLLGVMVLVAFTSIGSTFVFLNISDSHHSQRDLTRNTLPLLQSARVLSYEVNLYHQRLEQVYATDNAASLEQVPDYLFQYENDIRALLQELEDYAPDIHLLASLNILVGGMFERAERIGHHWWGQRVDVLADIAQRKKTALQAVAQMLSALKRQRIVGAHTDPAQSAALGETKEALARVELLLNRASMNSAQEQIKMLRQELIAQIRRLSRVGLSLGSDDLRQQLGQTTQTLLAEAAEAGGMFHLLEDWKRNEQEVRTLLLEIRTLAARLTSALDEFVAEARQRATRDISLLETRIDQSRLFNIATLGTLILGSLLLIFGYIRPRVTRRLGALAAATDAIAEERYEVAIDTTGSDELSQMAQALHGFRQSLQEKKQTMDMMGAILEVTDSGILVTDAYGAHMRSNLNLLNIWRLTELQPQAFTGLIHQTLASYTADPAAYMAWVQRGSSDPMAVFTEVIVLRDGRRLEMFSQSFYSSDQVFRIYSFRDVTQRLENQRHLEESRAQAEASNRAKSEFLATMSHEIRTPMNGVIGMLNLLLHTSLSVDQKQKADLALSSARSLLTLINDILDFSKIEAGRMELEAIDFNPGSMLSDLCEGMAPLAESKHIELIVDMQGLTLRMLRGDEGRVRQIFANLLGNAIKFTDEGVVAVRIWLEHETSASPYLHAEISDTGIGIPADIQDKLFDKFTQADSSTTRRFGGTGLGLAICKRLCEEMQGQISLVSREGEGSTFKFHIILAQATERVLIAPEHRLRQAAVLLVGGSPRQGQQISAQLARWEIACRHLAGVAALNALISEPANNGLDQYDGVMLDLAEMDGEQHRQLQAALRTPNLAMKPVCLIRKMKVNLDTRAGGWPLHAKFLRKPITQRALLQAVEYFATCEPTPEGLAVTALDLSAMPTGKLPALRALLVEDNAVNQMVAEALLAELGLAVEMASNGEEALAALRAAPDVAPFELVFMDCQMPVMDGYSASRAIRDGKAGERYLKVPIVAMTANAMKGDRERCLAAGMDEYVSKPIDINSIREVLGRVPLMNQAS